MFISDDTPGLDELLALAEVLERVEGNAADGGGTAYSRIIFDTAPTGHTLRLLAFPEFLNSLVTKLIALKSRLSGAIALLQVPIRAYPVHTTLRAHLHPGPNRQRGRRERQARRRGGQACHV